MLLWSHDLDYEFGRLTRFDLGYFFEFIFFKIFRLYSSTLHLLETIFVIYFDFFLLSYYDL